MIWNTRWVARKEAVNESMGHCQIIRNPIFLAIVLAVAVTEVQAAQPIIKKLGTIDATPMDLQFWPGAVAMMLIAALTAALVTNSGRSAWFVGVLVLMVYLVFAMSLYLLPPRTQ
jgi:Ca2+/H+ antiporter